MNKVLTLIKREFLIKIKSKFFIAITILGPFLMALLMFAPILLNTVHIEKTNLLIFVDNTGIMDKELSKLFVEKLKDGSLKNKVQFISSDRYKKEQKSYFKDIRTGKIKAVINISKDVFEKGEIVYTAKSLGDIEDIGSIKRKIQNVVNRIRMERNGIDPEMIDRLSTSVEMKTVKIEQGGREKIKSLGQDYIIAYAFLLLLYVVMLMYGANIMSGVVEEKTSRVIEVLLSSCSAFQLMLGKLFGVGFVGLFQISIWASLAAGGYYYMAINFPDAAKFIVLTPSLLVYLVIFFVLGFFQYSTMFLMGGSICSNQDDQKQVSWPLTMLIMVPFMIGLTFGIKYPDTTFVQVLSYIPFMTPMMMFVRIAVSQPPVTSIFLSLVFNSVFTIGVVFVVSKIYRISILSYGKRPSMKQMLKWIRSV